MKCEGWKTVKLGDVCNYISKGIPPKYTEDTVSSIMVLNQKCNRDNKINTKFARYHDCLKKNVDVNRILKQFDILVNSTGTGTAGRVAQVKSLNRPATVDGHMIILRNSDYLTPEYFGYALINKQSEIEQLAEGSTGQTEINRRRLLDEILISFPTNKSQQEAIASVLSALDDKIELNNRINENLEQQAQAIFKSWFVDFEPFQNDEFVDSELGRIPKGWRVGTLDEIVTILKESFNPKKHPNIKLEHYSIPAYDENKLPVFENSCEIKSNKYYVNKDSFLISKLNPTTKRIWRPFCMSATSVCSTEFIVYMPINLTEKSYCYSLIDSELFYMFLTSHVTGSTGSRQRAKPSETLDFQFVLPPKKIRNRYSEIATTLYEQIDNNRIENRTLAQLRDVLLPKLMSGEIRVPTEVE